MKRPKKANAERPKLSVYTDRKTLRRLRLEKLETDLTIEEIVNERLRLSYLHSPFPLAIREATASR